MLCVLVLPEWLGMDLDIPTMAAKAAISINVFPDLP
jgi:hypothetical protein